MCGIFGVRGHPDAVHLSQLGLYSLQHRGQESAGIVSIDEAGAARSVKVMGSLSDDAVQELAKHPAAMAVGHTRYSTAGTSTIETLGNSAASLRPSAGVKLRSAMPHTIVTGLVNRGSRVATSTRSVAATPRNSVARFCAIRRSVLIGSTQDAVSASCSDRINSP